MTYYTRKPSLLFSVVICILILFSKMRINKKYVLLLAVPILMFIGLLSAADINYYVDTYTRYVPYELSPYNGVKMVFLKK